MPEINDLIGQWHDYPPTNLLLKALLDGLSGKAKPAAEAETVVRPDMDQLRVISEISMKAGPHMPVVRGKDSGLPRTPPSFNVDELRQRNAEVLRRKAVSKGTNGGN